MLALRARHAAQFGHAAPDLAGRTQLRDGRELISCDGEPELESSQRVLDRPPGRGERSQIGHADRGRDRDFLRVRRTGVVVDGGVDGGDPQPRGRAHQGGEPTQDGEVGLVTGAGPDPDRVGTERAAERDVIGGQVKQDRRRGLDVGAGVERDRRQVEEHPVEHH